jgi:hypothetical protein
MSFMLQLRLTLTGGAGLALQTGADISGNTKEVTTPENPLFVGRAGCPLWVKSGHSSWVRQPRVHGLQHQQVMITRNVNTCSIR